jgi:hypothetical protein
MYRLKHVLKKYEVVYILWVIYDKDDFFLF